MTKRNRAGLLILPLIAASIFSTNSLAAELRYRAINPSFGGESFNSAHLLSIASAINDNREPSKQFDPLANFERSITSSLLSRISSEVADQILGEDAADSGEFTIGTTTLDFSRNGDVIDINISDGVSGGSTNIQVPAPVF